MKELGKASNFKATLRYVQDRILFDFSRMSSWGFMSFILSIVNGVINISNNINNNLNNRNNNNNDNNNNQFNTNIGNSKNTQMAGGMAMNGRKIFAIEKLREIRNRFRRKFEAKFGKIPDTDSPNLRVTTSFPSIVTSTITTTENPMDVRIRQGTKQYKNI